MSDVPVSGFPDPIGSSPSEARKEANSTSSTGAQRVGSVIGGAVAAVSSVRSSASEVLNSTAEGVKALAASVEKFTSGPGKRFSDSLEVAVDLLERARAAADGLGGAMGSVGESMLPWSSSAKESAKDAHEATTPQKAAATQVPGAVGAAVPAASQMVNGGANSVTTANQDVTINARNVKIVGGGGEGVGGSGGTGGNAGDKPNGGQASFGRRAMAFGATIGIGAAARSGGRAFNDIAGNLRAQQTAFQRGGFGSIPDQQRMMRQYLSSGISDFGQEDRTGALNIGFGNLGGTNFNMASLAALQQSSLDMSATQAAQVAQGAAGVGFRNRLYQYGVSTKGLDADQRLLAAARLALGRGQNATLTEQDYNRLSTMGETGFTNLQYLTGGNEQMMQSARDLVGRQAGITGLEEANPTLRSEVGRDRARAEMNNEMLDNIATAAEFRNHTLTMLYSVTAQSSDTLQDIYAAVGALSGVIQGGAGSVGAAMLGPGGAGGAGRTAAATAAGSAAGTAAAGGGGAGAVGSALGRVGIPIAIASGILRQGKNVWEAVRPGGGGPISSERMEGMKGASWQEWIGWLKEMLDIPLVSPFRDPVSDGIRDTQRAFGVDVGDPPDGSAIRTSKPTSHVTGLAPRMRSALEQMFRDNPRLRLNSGYRSIEHQQRLWRDALRKYGDPEIADNWVARPGGSKHNSGMAADIGPRSEYDWIARNASRYGLHLPMSHEPWHVEPIGSRSGKEIVDINQASGGLAERGDSAGTPDRRSAKFTSTVNLGEVTSSEGSIFAGLLGGGFLGPSPSAAPGRNVRSPSDSVGDSLGLTPGELAGSKGSPENSRRSSVSFSGSLAQRAEAVAYYAKQAGFSGTALQMAVAIALGESGGDPRATGDVSLQTAKWGPSLGLFQNRTLKHPERWSGLDARRDATKMYDPMYNAQFAYDLYRSKGNFGDWSVYTSGAYQQYMDEAAHGVAQVGDPATPGAGIDGAPRGGGSVVMQGGSRTVVMQIYGQQNPEALARQVAEILESEEDIEMVGMS